MCSTGHVQNRILFIERGLAYHKTEETDLLRSKRGSCSSGGVRCTANGGNGLVLERYGRNGVLFIGRGVAYRKTGLHGILFISTVDPLQPPRATVHPPSTSSNLHLRLFIHGLLFIQPPPRATPPATAQPPLHRLLFIQPSTPRVPIHPEATPSLTVHPNPPATLTVHPRGSIDRLQLAAVAKESLDRVQLTAIDRSLGFSNA